MKIFIYHTSTNVTALNSVNILHNIKKKSAFLSQLTNIIQKYILLFVFFAAQMKFINIGLKALQRQYFSYV
jgi:hypothetical protein